VLTKPQPRRVALSALATCLLLQLCLQNHSQSQAAAARAHPTATWQRRLASCGCTFTASTARSGRLACEWQSRCRGAVFQPSPALANQYSAENKAKSVPTEGSGGKRWRNRGRESQHKLGSDGNHRRVGLSLGDPHDISGRSIQSSFSRARLPANHVAIPVCWYLTCALPSEPTPQKQ
jgi:hypothetical protein